MVNRLIQVRGNDSTGVIHGDEDGESHSQTRGLTFRQLCGIERVDRMIEVHTKAVPSLQRTRSGNHSLSKLGVDAPIAALVCTRERRARDALKSLQWARSP